MTAKEHAIEEIDTLLNAMLHSKALKPDDKEAIRDYLLIWAENFNS